MCWLSSRRSIPCEKKHLLPYMFMYVLFYLYTLYTEPYIHVGVLVLFEKIEKSVGELNKGGLFFDYWLINFNFQESNNVFLDHNDNA